MCGICGIMNLRKGQPVRGETIQQMTAVMQHRGPDSEGMHVDGTIGLGHRRLSIIDLSTGEQPVYNEDGSICVVLNGEIYNYKELKESLWSAGHRFTTSSDTETIVHAYEHYGMSCLDKFRGMFTFALWDEKRERLFIARDRLGKKPLYYYLDDGHLVFASEIKSILSSGLVTAEVNTRCIDRFLSMGYVAAPDTMFKNIKKLPPGHYLSVSDGKVKIKKYWFLEDIKPGNLSFWSYTEELVRLLRESVEYRMISDVPLGAFLSGGIDSSIIVGLMSEHASRPVKTFSVGYRDQEEFSELRYARIASRHFGTDHREIILDPVDFYDIIPAMVWHSDEPSGDQANIPLWLMSKEARRHVTVILSGEGSDEQFAGYPVYALMKGIDWYRKTPGWVRSLVDPLVPRVLGERRGRKYLEWCALPLEERYLGDLADLSSAVRNQLYSDELLELTASDPASLCARSRYADVWDHDALSRMLYLDIKALLPDDLLLKADKMTMAASLELRCPFLDHKLVEFSRSIPSRYKLWGTETKHILKKSFDGFLPHEILHRKKKGFPVPLTAWFRDDLNTIVGEVLLDRTSLARGYFNAGFIHGIIRKQREKAEDYSKLLWSLLVLEFWHRTYIDGGTREIERQKSAHRFDAVSQFIGTGQSAVCSARSEAAG